MFAPDTANRSLSRDMMLVCGLALGAIAVAVVCGTALYMMIDNMRQMLGLMPVLVSLNVLVVAASVLFVWSLLRLTELRGALRPDADAEPANVLQGPWGQDGEARRI